MSRPGLLKRTRWFAICQTRLQFSLEVFSLSLLPCLLRCELFADCILCLAAQGLGAIAAQLGQDAKWDKTVVVCPCGRSMLAACSPPHSFTSKTMMMSLVAFLELWDLRRFPVTDYFITRYLSQICEWYVTGAGALYFQLKHTELLG